MAVKFYAVRKGRKPGIYRTWDECKAQVIGFSGAEYKSFASYGLAAEYMGSEFVSGEIKTCKAVLVGRNMTTDVTDGDAVKAYVDGSYNNDTKEFSYGMVILRDGEEFCFSEKYSDLGLAAMRNVAGEIKGAEAAMRYAVSEGVDSICIYHDYEGIAKWCLGTWKTNKDGTKAYKAYYDSIKNQVSVTFVKVAAHTGDKYNEIADKLAKGALGL